jgi:hypothetical protein
MSITPALTKCNSRHWQENTAVCFARTYPSFVDLRTVEKPISGFCLIFLVRQCFDKICFHKS